LEKKPEEYSMYFEDFFECASRERARLGGQMHRLF